MRVAVSAEEPLQTPANADKMLITVQRVAVDGAFPELEEQTAALISKIEGRRVSVAEVYELARALQQAYATAGYPLARVTFPSRDFRNGVIRIAVADGFIEDVDVSGVPERARDVVRARLAPLIGKRHATWAEVYRRILLLGDVAGLTGHTTSRRGSSVDGTILAIEGTEELVSGLSAVDNRQSRFLGAWEFSKAATVNNALGWGEQFYGSATSSSDFARTFDGAAKLQVYGGGVKLPIGFDGLKFNIGYLSVRTRPTSQFGAFPLEESFVERSATSFERVQAQAMYPVILTADQTLRVQASFDFTEERLRFGAAPLAFALPVGFVFDGFRDRYSTARFAADWSFRIPWAWGGQASVAAIYSHGLGGRTAWDAPLVGSPLSRPGANPVFNKLYLIGRIHQPLPEQFQLSLIAKAQTGFGAPLLLPEQLSLVGVDALSGFAAGTLNVDRGVTVRSELSRPFSIDLWGVQPTVSPYIFGAWGLGALEHPFLGENKVIQAESLGGGLRTGATLTGWPLGETLQLEFAKDFSNLPFRHGGYRTTVALTLLTGYTVAAALPSHEGPRRAPPPPPLWTGFYAGLNSGYSWDASPAFRTTGALADDSLDKVTTGAHGAASALSVIGVSNSDASGFIGGGQIGYNYQFRRSILGLEADIQGAGVRGRAGFFGMTFATFPGLSATDAVASAVENEKTVDWVGSVRGRVGYLVTPSLLAYATGGLAYGGVTARTRVTQGWDGDLLGPNLQSSGAVGQFSDTLIGSTVGGGLEWMFSPNSSVKAEFLHYDLGHAHFSSGPLVTRLFGGFSDTVLATSQTRFSGHIVRAGVNHRFDLFDDPATTGALALAPGSTGSALAADLPSLKGPPPAPPPPLWTGFYAGLNAGYSWDASPGVHTAGFLVDNSLDNFTTVALGAASALAVTGASKTDASGSIGGGQMGYNYQFDRFVFGLETDIQGAGVRGISGFSGTGTVMDGAGAADTVVSAVENEKAVDWLGSVRGRAGYLVTPSLLAYATGGLAYGGVTAHTAGIQEWGGQVFGPLLQSFGSVGGFSDTLVGSTVGGGLEWMVTPNSSVKAEYLHYDLGDAHFASSPLVTRLFGFRSDAVLPTSQTRFSGHVARAGVNYRFDLFGGLASVAAKY